MAWLSQFLLGRPCNEYSFEVNPEAMSIEETGVFVVQRNLAGDLKKSVLKASAPLIKVNSSYLSLAQRNQFASLVGIGDTFLSFRTRDDWQVTDESVTILSTTSIQLNNTSMSRLSAALVSAGCASIITILTPWTLSTGYYYGAGGFGYGGYGGPVTFDPGTVTYDDATRIATFTNALADDISTVLVSYTYTGWLVNMEQLGHKAQGGWMDRFTYDFQLTGA